MKILTVYIFLPLWMCTTLLKMADQDCGLRMPVALHSNRKCALNADWQRCKVYQCHSSKVVRSRVDNRSVTLVACPSSPCPPG